MLIYSVIVMVKYKMEMIFFPSLPVAERLSAAVYCIIISIQLQPIHYVVVFCGRAWKSKINRIGLAS
ncbi:hypothetical protein RIF29_05763 [Crotalaria pallida]|uniref:Uncharacterized protein n=1 Tax=Crotalaria pallida TaxID=3830 RepID=A0AAN9J359_CROPI